MTSVVYDGKVLAVDSRITINSPEHRKHVCTSCGDHTGVVAEDAEKLHVNKDGKWKFRNEKIIAMAGAGSSLHIKKVVDVIKNNDDVEEAFKHFSMLNTNGAMNFILLIVTEKQIYELEPATKTISVKTYNRGDKVFIGSGAKSAELAMALLGVGAAEAINLVMHVDKGTGGKIHSVDCTSDKLEVESSLPKKSSILVSEWKERIVPTVPTPVSKPPRVTKKVTPTKTTQEKKVVKAKQPEVKKTVTRLQPKSTNTARLPSFPTRV